MLNKLTTLCFSPTGGTARVAGHLSTALSGSTEIIDLLHPVAPRSFSSEDVVLIAMPVFGGRIPPLPWSSSGISRVAGLGRWLYQYSATATSTMPWQS